ncbi:Zinc finger, CCHC-type [Trema orientale]|uniref:Zinc finger, CCHC-type n=1 Tax=Trema orientale TaxID=63057 RepID=A0A2P5F907_TREOI|nr:Zinc finger, CCHC-type [Trema orientale]
MNIKELEYLFKVAEDAQDEKYAEIVAKQSATDEKLTEFTAKFDKLSEAVLRKVMAQASRQIDATVHFGSSLSQLTCSSRHVQDVRTSQIGLLPTLASTITTLIHASIVLDPKCFTSAPVVAPNIPPVDQAYHFSANGTTSASTFVKSHWTKGHENAPSISRPPSSQIECHRCHAKGHTASLCPQCTLSLNQIDDYISDDDPNIIIIKPLEVANAEDLGLNNDCEDEICTSFL